MVHCPFPIYSPELKRLLDSLSKSQYEVLENLFLAEPGNANLDFGVHVQSVDGFICGESMQNNIETMLTSAI